MRSLFIGGTRRGYQTLKALAGVGARLAGIISLRQDEHETDRYEEPIRSLAGELNVPFYESKGLRDRDYPGLIARELHPDVALVVGCRVLLPRAVYELPPFGTLAVHDSLLPEYRGFAPLNWSILNGEEHTGVTLFYLSAVVDEGDIVAQRRVPIGPDDTAAEVYERVCRATVDLVLEAYPLLAAGTASRLRQDSAAATYTCSRSPADGLIDWGQPTRQIYDMIRALSAPYPGAFTHHQGRRLTVWTARPVPDAPRYRGRTPGRVVATARATGSVDVLTGDGVLRVHEVQYDGAARTAATEVIHSVRCTLGLRLDELLDYIRLLEEKLSSVNVPIRKVA
jgi:methionyl-tRNA formyltransferase